MRRRGRLCAWGLAVIAAAAPVGYAAVEPIPDGMGGAVLVAEEDREEISAYLAGLTRKELEAISGREWFFTIPDHFALTRPLEFDDGGLIVRETPRGKKRAGDADSTLEGGDITLMTMSSGVPTGDLFEAQWGYAGCIPVPADYDGDGKADIAVYVNGQGQWHIRQTSNGQLRLVYFGLTGCVPVPADYDGDGKADIAFYKPDTRYWHIIMSSTGNTSVQTVTYWGWDPIHAVPADYDGDGKADLAIFVPSTGNWHVKKSTGGSYVLNWGWTDALPVPGKYLGPFAARAAVYHVNTGIWYVHGGSANDWNIQWGGAGTYPVPGDYDGDGKTDRAFMSDQGWHLLRSTLGEILQPFGLTTNLRVPADYDGDRITDVAMVRTWDWMWRILLSGQRDYDGDTLTNSQEKTLGTSPANPDTDDDDFWDNDELQYGTDPLNAASKPVTVAGTLAYAGGQTNGVYVVQAYTNTTHLVRTTTVDDPAFALLHLPSLKTYTFRAFRDVDGNGQQNAAEPRVIPPVVQTVTNTVENLALTLTDPDTDGDGLPDWWELQHFSSLTSQNGDGDADQDGASNLDEVQRGTDPNNADSDGDGIPDGAEIALGGNPTLPAQPGEAGLINWTPWRGM